MRYVSLSTDANPHYAVYAPMVARLWRRLGWEPIIAVHNQGWDTPFGVFIRDQLAGYRTYDAAAYPPLSVGNTMRVVRLTAPCLSFVEDDDTLMMSDVDMIPLSRTFFDVPSDWRMFVLRADMQGFLQPQLKPVSFRFAMCYTGARVGIWRELLRPYENDIRASIDQLQAYGKTETVRILENGGAIHALAGDSTDVDELWMTAHILSSDRAQGAVEYQEKTWEGYPVMRQGEVFLVPTREPGGCPNRMMLLGEWRGNRNANNWDLATAIDWHAPRPTASWVGGVVCRYWPEEAEWLSSYWVKIGSLTRLGE